MRSERKKQVMTLSILVAAVLVISVGFAAFSSTLKINTAANINPNATDFKVAFSNSSNSIDENDVTPTLTPQDITATNGAIDNTTTPTLSNITVDFTSPGQKAVYNLYVYNAGEYEAFLNSVMLQGNKSCTPGDGASVSLVGKACEDIVVSVKIGNDTYLETTTNITGKSIQKGQSTPIEITIEYLSGGDRADGPFSVEFNDISLYYATVSGQNEEYDGESGTLYTGTIYRNSNELLSVGDKISGISGWCLVVPGVLNFCDVGIGFNSKTECEALLEETINSGELTDEELSQFENATCESGGVTYEYETDLANISTGGYLKHEVVNNEVISSYACITYTENGTRKDVCLRGEDPTYYASNQTIMRSVESYFNTLDYSSSHTNYKGSCDFDDGGSHCYSDFLHLYAHSDGYVYALDGSLTCHVSSDGTSHCDY